MTRSILYGVGMVITMYRFMLVNRYNSYSIYYDNKKREYFRNNHINNVWNMIID